mmetsp:Transcript_10809/g.18192  ORF Transcript_10809/g.18192 Transcript_10809/m.18192 type:complete len:236 (-) Transcript_10809:14-721(-)
MWIIGILITIAITLLTVCSMSKQACYAAGKNKEVILAVLKPLADSMRQGDDQALTVLEIASGTGEHTNLFANRIPNPIYQPTEPQREMHESIIAWSSEITSTSKINSPIALDVNEQNLGYLLPEEFMRNQVDILININMVHISPWQCTDSLFRIAGECLRVEQGRMLTYGPYRVGGEMVESNIAFDESLKRRNPEWGIRDLEAIVEIAKKYQIELVESVPMPSNNLCLIFRKSPP